MPGRTIAIGDIHGHSLALKALVDAIAPGPEDRLEQSWCRSDHKRGQVARLFTRLADETRGRPTGPAS